MPANAPPAVILEPRCPCGLPAAEHRCALCLEPREHAELIRTAGGFVCRTPCRVPAAPEPRDLLIVMARDHPDRPPRYACRPMVDGRCLPEVSPGGHAADAIALLEPPTPADVAAFRAAMRVQP
jgi:hypothetical protein